MSNQHIPDIADGLGESVGQALVNRTVNNPPAKFALEIRKNQNSATVADDSYRLLPHLNFTITPLSSLEPDVLVLELPRHGLRTEDSTPVLAASYALADALNVAAAEPDLPTDVFPERLSSPSGAVSTMEGLESELGKFWSPREPHLDDRPDWALENIRVVRAWQVSEKQGRSSKGQGTIIAQPDTGVTAHSELRGTNFVSSSDFLGNDHDPTDPLTGTNPGHGTATASVTVSPPTLRITGAAPDAMHMPLRAIESVALVTQVTVARSIDWAVAHVAAVITMSLGGIPSFSLHRAVRRAVEANVIVLAAAGNCVQAVVWPARYDECLAVAGINAADGLWRGAVRALPWTSRRRPKTSSTQTSLKTPEGGKIT